MHVFGLVQSWLLRRSACSTDVSERQDPRTGAASACPPHHSPALFHCTHLCHRSQQVFLLGHLSHGAAPTPCSSQRAPRRRARTCAVTRRATYASGSKGAVGGPRRHPTTPHPSGIACPTHPPSHPTPSRRGHLPHPTPHPTPRALVQREAREAWCPEKPRGSRGLPCAAAGRRRAVAHIARVAASDLAGGHPSRCRHTARPQLRAAVRRLAPQREQRQQHGRRRPQRDCHRIRGPPPDAGGRLHARARRAPVLGPLLTLRTASRPVSFALARLRNPPSHLRRLPGRRRAAGAALTLPRRTSATTWAARRWQVLLGVSSQIVADFSVGGVVPALNLTVEE